MPAHIPATRRIAWDGLEFAVPAGWDLARYTRERHGGRLLLEDAYAVRLEVHWFRSCRLADLERVRRRYGRQFEAQARRRADAAAPGPLPPGWRILCPAADAAGERTALALAVPPSAGAIVFFLMRGGTADPETPGEVLRLLGDSLALRGPGEAVRWEVLDFAAELPASLGLERALFQAGMKHMLFGWRGRRLALWQASLADLLLKRQAGAAWAAGVLGRSGLFPGIEFAAAEERLAVGRRRGSLPGLWQRVTTRCGDCRAGWRHDAAANRLYLWALQSRGLADAAALRPLRFGPLDLAAEGLPLTEPHPPTGAPGTA